MPHYYLTHVGGLGDIVREELDEWRPSGASPARRVRRLHLSYDGDPAALLALRTVENVYALLVEIADVSPSTSWLDRLERLMASLDLTPALTTLARLKPLPPNPTSA